MSRLDSSRSASARSGAVIRFEQVSVRYTGGIRALDEVSFELAAGEMAFLTGHSGAGKSTLLRLIALMDRPSRGQVFIDGRNVSRLRRRQVPHLRRRIGVIFQDHRLLTDRRVFDNVALPLIIAGLPFADVRKRVRAALDTVGLLSRERVYPPQLSSGEQQRVGIARAIVASPAVLLADEPTGNLDPELSAQIMDLFERLNAGGTTLLIASHDLALVQRLGHRQLQLKQGQLIDDGLSADQGDVDGVGLE